jgi:hypothetical protein
MSEKFTPGPFVFAPYQDANGEQARITTIGHVSDFVVGLPSDIPGGDYRNGDPSGDMEADARLFAASYSLYMAAKQALLECPELMGTRAGDALDKALKQARGEV